MGWCIGQVQVHSSLKKENTLQSIPDNPCECYLVVPSIPSMSEPITRPSNSSALHSQELTVPRCDEGENWKQNKTHGLIRTVY